MECECCKEVSPNDYKKCQSDIELIKSWKETSPIKYVAPCGKEIRIGVKFTAPKRKKRKKK